MVFEKKGTNKVSENFKFSFLSTLYFSFSNLTRITKEPNEGWLSVKSICSLEKNLLVLSD